MTAVPAFDAQPLAKAGFLLIRNLLEGRVAGGSAVALEVAEALHNLPEPGNRFLECHTLKAVGDFVTRHPEFRSYFTEDLELLAPAAPADR